MEYDTIVATRQLWKRQDWNNYKLIVSLHYEEVRFTTVYLSILYLTIIAYYPQKSLRLMNKKITENSVNVESEPSLSEHEKAPSRRLLGIPVVNFVTRCTVT